jgi:hypothetical protein
VASFKISPISQVAKRALEVLHNCVHEVAIVNPSCPSGALSCWVLLSCLEVLAACDEYSDSSNRIQLYCLFTAAMWQYAREKLKDIGKRPHTFLSVLILVVLLPRLRVTNYPRSRSARATHRVRHTNSIISSVY